MTESREWRIFAEVVETGARRMGYPVTDTQVGRFVRHGKELMIWNESVNLTAVSGLEELAEKQFLDVIPLTQILPTGWRILDVGSGGGFPGVPLKVLRPDLRIGLVDAVRKKTSFLKHLVRSLGLSEVMVRQARVESLTGREGGLWGLWNGVVSKAMGRPDRVLRLCAPLVEPGGWMVAMAGKEAGGAMVAGSGFSMIRHTYRLPFSGVERSLVVLKRDEGNV